MANIYEGGEKITVNEKTNPFKELNRSEDANLISNILTANSVFAVTYGVTGVDDETTEIQAAIDGAITEGKTRVIFEEGKTYTATSLDRYESVHLLGENCVLDAEYNQRIHPLNTYNYPTFYDIPNSSNLNPLKTALNGGQIYDPESVGGYASGATVSFNDASGNNPYKSNKVIAPTPGSFNPADWDLTTPIPKVVIMGDSISTDALGGNVNPSDHPTDLLRVMFEKNTGETFNWVNRSIGGQRFQEADDVPTSFPTWYTVPADPWVGYVEDEAPDVVIISFGMNHFAATSNTDGQLACRSLVDKIKLFAKVPTIIFVNSMNPTMGTFETSLNTKSAQQSRDEISYFVYSFAKKEKYGLIDLNRMSNLCVNGFDVRGANVEKTFEVASLDFNDGNVVPDIETTEWYFKFGMNFPDGIDGSDDGHILELKSQLSSGTIRIRPKTGGLIKFQMFITGETTITRTIVNPLTSSVYRMSYKNGRLRISVHETIVVDEYIDFINIYNFKPTLQSGKTGLTPGKYVVNNLEFFSILENKYTPIITHDQMLGINTDPDSSPDGGNGVNHPSSTGLTKMYNKVIEMSSLPI